jgi:hypothetical protein
MYLLKCPFSFACCAILPLETLHPRRSEWGSSLPPDCFVSRGSISTREYYLTWVFTGRVVSTSPNPQAGGPPLVGCPRLLIQFIRSYPSYRRPFLHPQSEDAPCRGDRDPLTIDSCSTENKNNFYYKDQFLMIFGKINAVCSENYANPHKCAVSAYAGIITIKAGGKYNNL